MAIAFGIRDRNLAGVMRNYLREFARIYLCKQVERDIRKNASFWGKYSVRNVQNWFWFGRIAASIRRYISDSISTEYLKEQIRVDQSSRCCYAQPVVEVNLYSITGCSNFQDMSQPSSSGSINWKVWKELSDWFLTVDSVAVNPGWHTVRIASYVFAKNA